MIEITKQPFLENLCVLLICHDAQIDDFTEHVTSLYDPCVDSVYVCVDEKLDILIRAEMLWQIRTVFGSADIRIRSVPTVQIRTLAFYIYFYVNPEVAKGGKSSDKRETIMPQPITTKLRNVVELTKLDVKMQVDAIPRTASQIHHEIRKLWKKRHWLGDITHSEVKRFLSYMVYRGEIESLFTTCNGEKGTVYWR